MTILHQEAHAINAQMLEILNVNFTTATINKIIMTDIVIMFYYSYLFFMFILK